MSSSCALAYTPTCGPTAVGHCLTAQLTRGAERSLVIARRRCSGCTRCTWWRRRRRRAAWRAARGRRRGAARADAPLRGRAHRWTNAERAAARATPIRGRAAAGSRLVAPSCRSSRWTRRRSRCARAPSCQRNALGDGVGCIEDAVVEARPPRAPVNRRGAARCLRSVAPRRATARHWRRLGRAERRDGRRRGGGGAKGTAAWWSAAAAGQGLAHARELVFLNGHVDPTALVLAEPLQSVGGDGLPAQTRASSALSASAAARETTCWCGSTGYPDDCHTLVPLPEPPGGALVLSDSALLGKPGGAIRARCSRPTRDAPRSRSAPRRSHCRSATPPSLSSLPTAPPPPRPSVRCSRLRMATSSSSRYAPTAAASARLTSCASPRVSPPRRSAPSATREAPPSSSLAPVSPTPPSPTGSPRRGRWQARRRTRHRRRGEAVACGRRRWR